MKAKDGVNLASLSAEGWHAAHIADEIHRDITGRECTITSTTDGKHTATRSAHYRGDAVDVRIWHVEDPQQFADMIAAKLGGDYVVILESDHIHIHWAPVHGTG